MCTKCSSSLTSAWMPLGRAVSLKLGKPAWIQEGRWHHIPWKPFVETNLPRTTQGHADNHHGGQADWQVAWHGSKFETLYSAMYHGQLAESCSLERGDRFCPGAPGVYLHGETTKEKADNCMRFSPLFRDGVVWGATWEVCIDRSDRVCVRNTDQWAQRGCSAWLAALWVCGRRVEELEVNWEVGRCWDPILEANPTLELTAVGIDKQDGPVQPPPQEGWVWQFDAVRPTVEEADGRPSQSSRRSSGRRANRCRAHCRRHRKRGARARRGSLRPPDQPLER